LRFINRRENPNAIAGLFLLILLAVFAGPTVLPQLIANTIPFIDEGVPCTRLRDGSQRAVQQSLIGRAVSNDPSNPPVRLRVRTGGVEPDSTISISVIVINETLGTVPILVTEDSMILNPQEARNGIGVVFGQTPIPQGVGEAGGTYAADRIHLLGPRQLCVHRVRVPLSQIPNSSALVAENITATAFYRNNNPGSLAVTGTTLFPDQGLWVGQVESEPTLINTG
jgi:hypothetical protein